MAEEVIEELIIDWVCWAVMAGMFLEGLMVPYPGALIVPLAGTLSVKPHLSLPLGGHSIPSPVL